MSTDQAVPQTPFQRLIVDRALEYARRLERAADSAPDGSVLAHCEKVALDRGREILRLSVADAIQAQAEPLGKTRPANLTRGAVVFELVQVGGGIFAEPTLLPPGLLAALRLRTQPSPLRYVDRPH